MKLKTIEIGQIVNAHGTKGEVRVQPRDGDPAFLTRFHTFLLDGQPVQPTANHVHKNFTLMKFPGVEDMDAALALKGKVLYLRREDAELKETEFFDEELLGMEVFAENSGEKIGELIAVDPYPAHPIYTVRGQHEYLIPAVPEVFIRSVDLDANRMVVHLLEGMESDAD